jgi:hypothetical protein
MDNGRGINRNEHIRGLYSCMNHNIAAVLWFFSFVGWFGLIFSLVSLICWLVLQFFTALQLLFSSSSNFYFNNSRGLLQVVRTIAGKKDYCR